MTTRLFRVDENDTSIIKNEYGYSLPNSVICVLRDQSILVADQTQIVRIRPTPTADEQSVSLYAGTCEAAVSNSTSPLHLQLKEVSAILELKDGSVLISDHDAGIGRILRVRGAAISCFAQGVEDSDDPIVAAGIAEHPPASRPTGSEGT